MYTTSRACVWIPGHMPDQVSILLGQNRTVVGRFFLIIILSGSLFEIIIPYHYLLIIW